MAFVAWRTWVAGAVATAAQMNQDVRDNLNAWFPLASTSGTAWTSYTPTLTQSATVTKTVSYAKYTQVGKTVTFQVHLVVTGLGTANNAITIGLPPVTAATTQLMIGAGKIFDTSVGPNYPGLTYMSSTTTVQLIDPTAATTGVLLGQSGAVFSAALAVGDTVDVSGIYEAA